ncbi:MAG: hypothetical protein JG765_281 [Cereibacter sp.]|jgi:hypothetical protein|nr:hypothetical protein [Cereibacter sp.]
MTALLIFPCLAILWLLLADRLGWLTDQPLRTRSTTAPAPDLTTSYAPLVASGERLSNSGPSKATRR